MLSLGLLAQAPSKKQRKIDASRIFIAPHFSPLPAARQRLSRKRMFLTAPPARLLPFAAFDVSA
ncbi:MAG: hypothetical protein DME70_01980 [Verrucomicrobia bacterium]|nr:MAG: hypothetical protein DME70_01980 [Verrucomicrobiota bacterium]